MARRDLRRLRDEPRLGQQLLRRAVHVVHARLRAAHHERVRDVVAAVAHVDELLAADVAERLLERHEVCEDLRRVRLVREAVPDRDAAPLRELLDRVLLVAAEENAVVEAAEDAR